MNPKIRFLRASLIISLAFLSLQSCKVDSTEPEPTSTVSPIKSTVPARTVPVTLPASTPATTVVTSSPVVVQPAPQNDVPGSGYEFPMKTTFVSSGTISTVPTFNSVSIYFNTVNSHESREALVRYRKTGTSKWIQGHTLWFDARSNAADDLYRSPAGFGRQYRGSLVQVEASKEYDIQVALKPSGEIISTKVKTWSEEKPIKKKISITASSNQTLNITESGSEAGYILYEASPNVSIDVQRKELYNIYVNASYVIIRGFTLKNAMKHGIALSSTSRNVIIEKNDISRWGRVAPDAQSQLNNWGMNLDSAVSTIGKSNGAVTQLVIQNNRMHDPIPTSNNWEENRQDYDEFEQPRFSNGAPVMNPHPIGPQAISLTGTGGNHVIRFNAMYSSDPEKGTKFNDAIGGGGSNFTTGGAPGKDSDIYGNQISDTWDDGIESEGGNMNVRIWNNQIQRTYMSIAISPVAVGPMYVFRNIAGHTRRNPGDKKGGNFIKGQSRISTKKVRDPKDNTKVINVPDFIAGGGRVFVYHNTSIGQLNVGISRSNEQLLNYVTRNNILQGRETAIQGQVPLSGSVNALYPKFDQYFKGHYFNDFDHDLMFPGINLTESKEGLSNTPQVNYEKNREAMGIVGTPRYRGTAEAPFMLAPDSLGINAGTRIPNFNDTFVGSEPDMGAEEAGATPIKFGPR